MAVIRELHPDQARYAQRVAELTGLDAGVLRAAVGASSGIGVALPGHGYLTGGRFPDVDTAARRAAVVLERHGLDHFNVVGPLPQLVAVGQHRGVRGTVAAVVNTWAVVR